MTMPAFTVETGVILALAAGFGALGGLTRYLVTNDAPLRTIVAGVIAAFAAIFVAKPTDWIGLVTGAAAAGYASEAVLAGFVIRTKLDTAKKEAELAKLEAKSAKKKHNAAEQDLSLAIGALKSAAPSGLEMAEATTSASTIADELQASQNKRNES
jgi:hypothetical protein